MLGAGLDGREEIFQAPAEGLATVSGAVGITPYQDQVRAVLVKLAQAGLVSIHKIVGSERRKRTAIDWFMSWHTWNIDAHNPTLSFILAQRCGIASKSTFPFQIPNVAVFSHVSCDAHIARERLPISSLLKKPRPLWGAVDAVRPRHETLRRCQKLERKADGLKVVQENPPKMGESPKGFLAGINPEYAAQYPQKCSTPTKYLSD
jgi:hypothetical protein